MLIQFFTLGMLTALAISLLTGKAYYRRHFLVIEKEVAQKQPRTGWWLRRICCWDCSGQFCGSSSSFVNPYTTTSSPCKRTKLTDTSAMPAVDNPRAPPDAAVSVPHWLMPPLELPKTQLLVYRNSPRLRASFFCLDADNLTPRAHPRSGQRKGCKSRHRLNLFTHMAPQHTTSVKGTKSRQLQDAATRRCKGVFGRFGAASSLQFPIPSATFAYQRPMSAGH